MNCEIMFMQFSPTGGTQVLDFEYVGMRHSVQSTNLKLQHGSQLYVTVLATNGAGLTTAAHASPVTIDMTPPEMCCLRLRQADQEDVMYLHPGEVTISWNVSDEDTGIQECSYSLGMC